MTLTAAVAAEVRAEMGRRRITQAELAAGIGRTQQFVSRRISGDVAMDTDDIDQIARHLGVSPLGLLQNAAA
jgi:transcriptional regulator with XRE-family HTH domain